MQVVIGAVIFAVGTLFGAGILQAGQQNRRASQEFQDTLRKAVENSVKQNKSPL